MRRSKADLQVDVLQAQAKITACADSLATFGALAGDIASLFSPVKSYVGQYPAPGMAIRLTIDRIPAEEEIRSPAALEHSINVFGNVNRA